MNAAGNEAPRQPEQEVEATSSGAGGCGLAGDPRPSRIFRSLPHYLLFERAMMLHTFELIQISYTDQMDLLREKFARQLEAVENLFTNLHHQISELQQQVEAEIEHAVCEAKKRLSTYLEDVHAQVSQVANVAEQLPDSAPFIKQLTKLGKARAKENEAKRRLHAAAPGECMSARQHLEEARQEFQAVWEDYNEAIRTNKKLPATTPEKQGRPRAPAEKPSSRQVLPDAPQDATSSHLLLTGNHVSAESATIESKSTLQTAPPDPILDPLNGFPAVQTVNQMAEHTRKLLNQVRETWEPARSRLGKLQSILNTFRPRLKDAAECNDPNQREDLVRQAACEQADELILHLRRLDELISGREAIDERQIEELPSGPEDLQREVQTLRDKVYDYVHTYGDYQEYDVQTGKSATEYGRDLEILPSNSQGITLEDNHIVQVIHKGYFCKRGGRVHPKPRVYVYRHGR